MFYISKFIVNQPMLYILSARHGAHAPPTPNETRAARGIRQAAAAAAGGALKGREGDVREHYIVLKL